MENNENTPLDLSADTLDSALADLKKATDAVNLVKGGGGGVQDTPQHTDERGPNQGKLATKADFAGFDTLMIGKMRETLADAGFSPAEITAFMKDEDEGKKKKKGGFPWAKMEEEEEEDMGKSLTAFLESEDIREGMDASPFLESMVKSVTARLDRNEAAHARRLDADRQSLTQMAQSLTAVSGLVKSLTEHSQIIADRLSFLESTPAPARGAGTLAEAQRMAKSAAPGGAPAPDTLSKSHIGNTLSYMRCVKGIENADGVHISDAVSQVESNLVRPEVASLVKSFLVANPNEAVRAVNYR